MYSSSAAKVQEGGRGRRRLSNLVVLILCVLRFCIDGRNSLAMKKEKGRASQTEHGTRQALESFGTVSFCYLGLVCQLGLLFHLLRFHLFISQISRPTSIGGRFELGVPILVTRCLTTIYTNKLCTCAVETENGISTIVIHKNARHNSLRDVFSWDCHQSYKISHQTKC